MNTPLTHTNYSLFGFGIIVFHDDAVANNAKNIGYEIFNINGKYYGLNYPRWFYKLIVKLFG